MGGLCEEGRRGGRLEEDTRQRRVEKTIRQGSYGSVKSMKVQDFLVVKIMYLNVLNFPETVEKSIKVHIKRV